MIHARLSASGAYRWMRCPGSAPSDGGSRYAEEGIRAHELAENILLGRVHDSVLKKFDDQDMVKHCLSLKDFIDDIEADEVMVEQKVDFSEWVPGGFGTSDVIAIKGSTLYIVDLKYGKGIQVFAEGNEQMRLYALGAINDLGVFYDFEDVKMVIFQPRLDHISESCMDVEDLLEWAEEVVRPCAEAAGEEGAKKVPGDKQCQFCGSKATCKALAEYALSQAVEGFDTVDNLGTEDDIHPRDIDGLTSIQVSRILPRLPLLEAWAKAVKEYAKKEALAGHEIPGYEIVQGRPGNRSWSDEDTVKGILMEKYTAEQLFGTKLISPTQFEKMVPKAEYAELSEYVHRPEGGPQLAPIGSGRPSFNPADGF